MMKITEIREIIKLIDDSSIDELELENDGVQITIKKALPVVEEVSFFAPAPAVLGEAYQQAAVTLEMLESAPSAEVQNAPVLAEEAAPAKLTEITSNWVGAFASSPKPGAEAFVKKGDKVKAGQVVCRCHVDILKLSHDIQSPADGEIVDILVQDDQFIDYGQPLFLVKAD